MGRMVDFAQRGVLFEGLSIWREEKYCKMQGTYPVLYHVIMAERH